MWQEPHKISDTSGARLQVGADKTQQLVLPFGMPRDARDPLLWRAWLKLRG